ncbi:MAG: TadE/TadG family type IV pilus assembly protein [Hespellia sp.]|nr:TadE/TadG family type IV pilus assembly protein [Hespellia sp.]
MRKKAAAVTTVEMAYIMPVVLLVFLAVVYTAFYFHDKNVLSGMAYETALIGAQTQRLPEEMKEEEMTGFFREHTAGKLILLSNPQVTVSRDTSYVIVKATASRRRMKINVEMKALIMEPEKFIRMIRKVKK